jgi:hypothetical protein
MKNLVALIMLLAALCAAPVVAAESDAVAKAQDAAKAWLALVDGGKYAQSWDEASSRFRATVSKADWEKMLAAGRSPLGAVRSRKVKSATFTRELPGAPAGEYVVIQYDTDFANKASTVETVTPMLDKDGAWRVSGYFIR